MVQHKIAGLKLVAVRVDAVQKNPWNPNRMTDETFEKEKRSILEHGFIDPITVRELEDGAFQIIDGEQRWRAAGELGIKEIPSTNLGPISDHKAKKLTIIYNELRGAPEPVLLARMLRDLVLEQTVPELSMDLPMTAVEIDSLVKAATEFDWGASFDPLQIIEEGPGRLRGAQDERKFSMGSIRGNIPIWLLDQLMVEFDKSASAVRTKNPELVLRDWVNRLKRTPPVVTAEPPAQVEGKKAATPKAAKVTKGAANVGTNHTPS